jgi:hypothetical protein
VQEAQQESEQQVVQPLGKQTWHGEPGLPAKLEETEVVDPLDSPHARGEGDSLADATSAGDEPAPVQGFTPLPVRPGQQAASPAASDEANTPHSQQGELMQRTRGMVAAETEAAMAPLLVAQSDVALAQWLVKLQGTLADEAKRHKEAQRRLKHVGGVSCMLSLAAFSGHCLAALRTHRVGTATSACSDSIARHPRIICMHATGRSWIGMRWGTAKGRAPVLQVDRERHEARRRYREDQRNQVNQSAWRAKVILLKQAQSELRASRESYFKWVVLCLVPGSLAPCAKALLLNA